ncbi:unnamed protein product [Arctia plantaginis]|uniref:TIL domain-containing protein n=1 Tax=Arctia plantaginis TaxID=874455 RepID=A0A8S0ZC02_ARCPL|nr:unnamed protein product [Arctia plantaginis]
MQEKSVLFICFIALSTAIYIAQEDCPPNEEYLLCGSPCPFNCTNPDGQVQCSDDCIEGCFCKTGYLRNDNGTCVSIAECGGQDDICDANEEFLSCGTACPGTCKQPDPIVCELACSMGCFCKAGYVRDTASGQCVTLDKCPTVKCPNENEVWDVCNGLCEPSCADQEPVCAFSCTGGCICGPGLLRNATGECVTPEKCGNITTNPLTEHLNAISKLLDVKFLNI